MIALPVLGSVIYLIQWRWWNDNKMALKILEQLSNQLKNKQNFQYSNCWKASSLVLIHQGEFMVIIITRYSDDQTIIKLLWIVQKRSGTKKPSKPVSYGKKGRSGKRNTYHYIQNKKYFFFLFFEYHPMYGSNISQSLLFPESNFIVNSNKAIQC